MLPLEAGTGAARHERRMLRRCGSAWASWVSHRIFATTSGPTPGWPSGAVGTQLEGGGDLGLDRFDLGGEGVQSPDRGQASLDRTGSWPRPFSARLRAPASAAWLIKAPVTWRWPAVKPSSSAWSGFLLALAHRPAGRGRRRATAGPRPCAWCPSRQIRLAQGHPGDHQGVALVAFAGSTAPPTPSAVRLVGTSTTASPAARSSWVSVRP